MCKSKANGKNARINRMKSRIKDTTRDRKFVTRIMRFLECTSYNA